MMANVYESENYKEALFQQFCYLCFSLQGQQAVGTFQLWISGRFLYTPC